MTIAIDANTAGASSTASKNTPGTHENVTCPFCGILCDDLEITGGGGGIKVVKNGCEKAIAGFERVLPPASPMVDGKPASLEAAVAAAARIVSQSKLPLYGGLGTDVEGMRAVMALADRSGGVVDHALSEGQYRNFRVLQSGGWVMSTLTEARNRADLFVVVASDLHKLHPRFFERVVCAPHSMFSDSPPKRSVVFLGSDLDMSAAVGPRIGDVVSLPCPPERVIEIIAAIRALLKGQPVAGDEIAGVKRADIEALAERMKAATYGVMVWAPPSLAFPNADLTVQLTSELVKDLNVTGRFAGLSLGGNEGAVSAGAVCAWQSGYPLRVSYASGKPDHDIVRYSISRLLQSGEADSLVWISSFTTDIAVPDTKAPTVVLATPGMAFKTPPAVFIPIGTPGIDHSGRIVRCDNVVSLPLQDLGRSKLPRLTDVLSAIEAAL